VDPIGIFIAHMHQLLGHTTTARFLGQPVGDKRTCVLCIFERNPTPANKQAVVQAIGTSRP
jgi:hypothetical protein